MASKQLTAQVRLNSTQAEQKLRNLAKAIDALNKSVGRVSNAQNSVNNALGKTVKLTNQTKQKTDTNVQSTNKWAMAIKAANSQLGQSKGLVGSIGSGLKTLVNRYLGVMGMGTVISTSDAITSAENKLNYINGGDKALTQEAMDKMYTSAQKVRMSYTDMMSNVSKSMTLAGDAFNNNTDAAIRFQEIMAEAYAVGGASAQEMSSSMYQLIQALGAGTLAGDELRSVREGAPLAYKQIEKFAQGVYNTEESLKDLASQGKITSDMVVTAIMNAGNEMDNAFAQTEQTFAQTWEQIKNAAKRAFIPVSEYLREALNKAIDNGLIQKVEKAFGIIAKCVLIVFEVIQRIINWVVDNWSWIKDVLLGVATALLSWYIILGLIKVAMFVMWVIANKWLLWIAYAIFAVIKPILSFVTGIKSLTEAIQEHLFLVGIGLLVLAIMIGNWWVALAGAIVLSIWATLKWLEYVLGALTWFGILCKNIGLEIAGFFVALSWVIANAFMSAVEFVVDIFNGCCSWIAALVSKLVQTFKNAGTNIGIAFENAWIAAQNGFWSFIGGCLNGIKKLEPAINAVAKAFGAEGFTLSGVIDNVAGKQQKYKEYIKVSAFEEGWSGNAWNKGTSKWTAPKWAEDSSWSEMQNSVGGFEKGWSQDAFNIGYGWGTDFKNWLDNIGSKFQLGGKDKEGSWLDDIGKKLGLDTGKFDDLFNNNNGGNNGGNKLNDLLNDVGDINGNTGKMADSMDLTEEDLKYLRSIAEMEWKKEYTTAEIKVEMTNNNNINGESDLDGIVTKLSDKLYEELNIVADGVYAY